MNPRTTCLCATLALAALAFSSPAQTIAGVIPEAGAPGDVLILEGSNLGAATTVDFVATVGGFAGILTRSATVTSASPTRVTVVVPQINAFAPPNATPPGDPMGSLRIQTANGRTSNTVAWFYMEATFGSITTLGNGTTQPGGIGRPVAGFDLQGGAPAAGNAGFRPTLGNAQPNSFALFALGFPATPPFPMIGDGTIVIDQTAVLGTLVLPVSGSGDSGVNLPIPSAPFNTTFLIQWAVLSGAGAFLSNGLQFDL